MKRIPLPTVITAVLLIAALLIFAVTFQVRFSEQAVVVRWGRADAGSVVKEPGLHFRWPYPVEAVQRYDTRLRVLDTAETEIKTADGQNLIVGSYALWRIADPLQFYVRIPHEGDAESLLRTRLDQVRQRVLGQHPMGEIVNLDSELVAQNYDKLQKEMLDGAAGELRKDYGIELVKFGVRRISLPENATEKVQEAMRQERERLASRFRTEGQARAATIKSAAEAERDQILQFVDRRAKEIETEGDRATERIYAQIKPEDNEFFIWLRALEALEASLKTRTTIFLDSNSELIKYFNAPFQARTKAAASAPARTRE